MSKITIDRSVVEQALEALYSSTPNGRDWTEHGLARQALRAALEQQDHSEQHLDMVPTGWRLVPMEPTGSQTRAAQDTWWHACNSEMYWDQIYAAMIAAAPQPPTIKQSLTVKQPQVEQIGEIEGLFSNEFGLEAKHSIDFARAMEAAHGIKEQK